MRILTFIAASCLFTGSVAAEIGTTNFSTENNHFGVDNLIKSSNLVDLGHVRAAGNGEVVLHLAKGIDAGRQIGSAPVHQGANINVRVPVERAPVSDIVAVLYVDGEAVASRYFDVGDERNDH